MTAGESDGGEVCNVPFACDVCSYSHATCEKGDSFLPNLVASFFLFMKPCVTIQTSTLHALSTLPDLTEYQTNLQPDPAQLLSALHNLSPSIFYVVMVVSWTHCHIKKNAATRTKSHHESLTTGSQKAGSRSHKPHKQCQELARILYWLLKNDTIKLMV